MKNGGKNKSVAFIILFSVFQFKDAQSFAHEYKLLVHSKI